MNELIKLNDIEIGNELVQTVNARDLHAFLESRQDFSTWIKNRIEKYGFVENVDYVIVENLSSPDLANAKARPQKLLDYYISIGMAKELAMVENNDKCKQDRKYFIECEKQLQQPKFKMPTTLLEAGKLWIAEMEANEETKLLLADAR